MKKNLLFALGASLLIGSQSANSQVLSEGFETGAIPTNWTEEFVSATVSWSYETGNTSSVLSAHGGTYNARFYSGNYNGDATKLVTATMDLSVVSNPELTFWYTNEDWSGDQDVLTIYYKTSAGGAWTSLGSYSTTLSSWTQEIIPLPNASADYYIAFEGTSGYGYGVTIDDVTVDAGATCPFPNMLTATSITATTADLGWTENGSAMAWQVEIGPPGFTTGMGTATVTGTNPFAASGLTAATDYDFYVRSICGVGDTSTWYGPMTFSTECAVITPDYTQTFDMFPGTCWDVADNGNISTGPTNLGTSSWSGDGFLNDGTSFGGARINLYSDTKEDWLLSPEFDISVGEYKLVIEAGVTDWLDPADDVMGSDDQVNVFMTLDGGTTWNSIYQWDASNEPAYTGQSYDIPLTGLNGTAQFGIWASEGTVNDAEDYDFHIGTFEVIKVSGAGINDIENKDFSIYPNPNNGQFTISNSGTDKDAVVEITDIQGKVIYSSNLNLTSGGQQLIDLNDAGQGIYIVRIISNNITSNHRIVVK